MPRKINDPFVNTKGLERQRWPAPPTPADGVRSGKLAFRLSDALREQIELCAQADRMPTSSWVEQLVRTEVERRITANELRRREILVERAQRIRDARQAKQENVSASA